MVCNQANIVSATNWTAVDTDVVFFVFPPTQSLISSHEYRVTVCDGRREEPGIEATGKYTSQKTF